MNALGQVEQAGTLGIVEMIRLEAGRPVRPDEGEPPCPLQYLTNDSRHRYLPNAWPDWKNRPKKHQDGHSCPSVNRPLGLRVDLCTKLK
jgi:hypothetical protein